MNMGVCASRQVELAPLRSCWARSDARVSYSANVYQHRPRPAFTLVEVVLVLALLVIVASMAMPVMTGTLTRSQLRNAGEVVRTAWQRARLSAMETGQVHIFRCELEGRQFQVLSIAALLEGGDESGNSTKKTNLEVKDDAEAASWRLRFDRLPSDVVFSTADIAPSPALVATHGKFLGQAWTNPVVFQPDGSSNDAAVLLKNSNGWTIKVTLRGINGTVRVGDIGAEGVN